MDDAAKWIAEEAAVVWLRRAYGLSQGAAKAELRTAFDSGNVEVTDFINKEIEVEGKLKRIHIPATISYLVVDDYVHDLHLNSDDLRWQIKQQLGKPPPGVRTNRAAAAEAACGKWLDAQTEQRTKAVVFEAARADLADIGPLSKTAFDRAWAGHAPTDWKRQGRPHRKTP